MNYTQQKKKHYYECKSKAKSRGQAFLFKNFEEFDEFLESHNYDQTARVTRIDKKGPFSPQNCYLKWNMPWPYDEPAKEMAKRLGINEVVLRKYIKQGNDLERLFDENGKRIYQVEHITKDPLYMKWAGIVVYARKKGLTICWKRFEDFRDWSHKNGYKEGLFLVRKNRKGNYTEENCLWYPHKKYLPYEGRYKNYGAYYYHAVLKPGREKASERQNNVHNDSNQ